jgi:hypothetical protein
MGLVAIGLCLLSACNSELGECDQKAAEELVYGRNGMVATKGQALAHDTCGNGVFCHSASATGKQRYGAHKGMDFDMLPTPSGIADMLKHRELAWDAVNSGFMPPPSADEVIGDGQWSVDVQRRSDAPTLPGLTTKSGKAAFRNWLACGAPTVTETRVPGWAQGSGGLFDPEKPVAWADIYELVMKPSCALAGCHDTTSKAGGLAMPDSCKTHSALMGRGICGKTFVVAGQPEMSFLSEKLESERPSCGDAMPPGTPLADDAQRAIRRWIQEGAQAEGCP